MKRLILFFTTLLFAVSVFGQEVETQRKSLFFNEFSLSVNRTNVSSSGIENRFGGGAGVYHSFVLGQHFDLVLGLEYNYISLFADDGIKWSPRYYYDEIQIHTFSPPFTLRFSIGKNVKYFLDAGVFLGVLVANEKGKAINPHPTPENPQNLLPTQQTEIGVHFGSSFGTGIKIPMKQIEWIVKADYNIELKTNIELEILEYAKCNIHYYRLCVGIRKK